MFASMVKPVPPAEQVAGVQQSGSCAGSRRTKTGKTVDILVLFSYSQPINQCIWKARQWQSEHPDIRLARRARTIAELARIISERKVGIGIRRTLWVQAQRLEHLARSRLDQPEQERKP